MALAGRLVAWPEPDPVRSMLIGGQLSVSYSGKTQGSSLVRCKADGSFRLDLLPRGSSGTLTVLKHRGRDSFDKASATSAVARSGDRNVILHLRPN